ncbi:16S rRNA pseudouridine(516) synthase [Aquincola sp. S2]|uniref:Pseudouridine synthase n=1 Tax=Pseudaquabacterium terrae TaxID=2732868 RepID=A0ABX2EH42_9BURK|nr:16S rRNA pseudouridine(516) synthase [Aquabacterium terrae]NRF67965.1 16S rRNA pseudouridine(516) synthase [Aquabacterium terrae]
MAGTKKAGATQRLDDILFSQGFGTRRIVAGLIDAGLVRVGGKVVSDPGERFPTEGLQFEVESQPWTYHAKALVLLHKPAGYECSQKPSAWPSVLLLLPAPLRQRGVQPIGRLDQDTTGLLLLTDDGALIHRLTSPKKQVPKVYEISTDRPVEPKQVAQLLAGVVLDDDPRPVLAEGCEITGERALRLTLVQGKYHQVKRMVAAVGNHVVGLHRSRFGALELPADLAPGRWQWLDGPQVITG